MAKHMLIWRIVNNRVPENPRERGEAWGAFMKMVENDLESGVIKDWGTFPGEGKGYVIFEGSNHEMMKMTGQYNPFAIFEVHPVATISEVKEYLKVLTG